MKKKKIARLGKIDTSSEIINKKKVILENGTTVYTATIKRNKPIPPAK